MMTTFKTSDLNRSINRASLLFWAINEAIKWFASSAYGGVSQKDTVWIGGGGRGDYSLTDWLLVTQQLQGKSSHTHNNNNTPECECGIFPLILARRPRRDREASRRMCEYNNQQVWEVLKHHRNYLLSLFVCECVWSLGPKGPSCHSHFSVLDRYTSKQENRFV